MKPTQALHEAGGTAYDADIAARKASGATDEQVFFDLALQTA